MNEDQLRDTLLACEQRLLHGEPTEAGELLEPGFEEVGPDGAITGRDQVLAWLRDKPSSLRWEFLEFRVRPLGAGLALARYRARRVDKAGGGSRRLSIWRRDPDSGLWRLCFHQATRVQPVDGG